MSRYGNRGSESLEAVAKAFRKRCAEVGVACVSEMDFAYVKGFRIPMDSSESLLGYMAAITEQTDIDMSSRVDGKHERIVLFQEEQRRPPTAAHSREQAQFPAAIDTSRTHGGVEYPIGKKQAESGKKRKKRSAEDAVEEHIYQPCENISRHMPVPNRGEMAPGAYGFRKPAAKEGSRKTKGEKVEEDLSVRLDTMISDFDNQSMVNEDVVERLNDLRAGEIASALQYQLFKVIVPGMSMGSLEEIFAEHEADELEHANKLAQRIHQLNGKPVCDLGEIASRAPFQVQDAYTAEEMVAILREQEEQAIADYTSAIADIGDSDPATRLLLEEILTDEYEHATDFRSMLESL